MSSPRGRCPICGLFMRSFKTHFWRDKELFFPYDIFRCVKHGIFFWHENRYKLVNFQNLPNEIEVSPLPKDTDIQWFDPTIVEMKCPICGEEWNQDREFPSKSFNGIVFCPNNHGVKREEALKG